MTASARIIHLIGQLKRGGAEKQLFCTATGLQKRGWTQSVIAFDCGGLWEPRVKAAGIPVFTIPRNRFKPLRLWRLRTLVSRQTPAILVSWSEHVAVYAQWLHVAGPLRRVYSMRGELTADPCSGKPRAIGRLLRRAVEAADWVLSNSRRNLDIAREHGMRIPRSTVIYNTVAAPGRARPGELASCPRIVGAATLTALKSFDTLLAALGELAGEGLPYELLLAGDGPERAALEGLAVRCGIADRVKFLGEVADVPGLLASAQLLVHPSVSEGLSNTVLEAMAEGLPVVVCPAGGNTEIIEDGRSGLLVPPRSPEQLAAAVRRLLTDAALRGRMGDAALESVRRLCDEDVVLQQFEKCVRGCWRDDDRRGRQ